MKNALLHQINMVIGKQNNHCVHALDTVMLLGRTSSVCIQNLIYIQEILDMYFLLSDN